MSRQPRLLFIAPFPPPVTGQSAASLALAEDLGERFEVITIDYSKRSFAQGVHSIGRFLELGRVYAKIIVGRRGCELVYLTISQSLAGNLRDILICLILKKLLPRTVLHLHGGGIGRELFEKYPLVREINRRLLADVGGVIVLSESIRSAFSGVVSRERIHVVPNFAEEGCFVELEAIDRKFASLRPLRLLYLSNFMYGKGYAELLEAFAMIAPESRAHLRLSFAGAFDDDEQRRWFLTEIKKVQGAFYLGVLSGPEKWRVLRETHILCLPTYNHYEGQPLCILEGYAAGCAVITTGVGGISDVFKDGVHGMKVEPRSVHSLGQVIGRLTESVRDLHAQAVHNHGEAVLKYRRPRFSAAIADMLEEIGMKRKI